MDGEREAWIDMFRNTTKSLGQIIQVVYLQREAVWTVDEGTARSRNYADTQPVPKKSTGSPKKSGGGGGSGGSPAGKGSQQQHQGAKYPVGKAAKIAPTLRDKTPLCAQYQHGKCKASRDCPQGKHFCGGVQDSDRVCGARHPACRCTNEKVKKV